MKNLLCQKPNEPNMYRPTTYYLQDCYREVRAAAAAESLAVWAVINQIADCITGDTIHYIAMYISDSFNFDTVSFLVYRA